MLQSNIHAKHIYLYFIMNSKNSRRLCFLGTDLARLKFPPLGGNSGHESYLRKGEFLLFEAILRIAVFLLMREWVLLGWRGSFLKKVGKIDKQVNYWGIKNTHFSLIFFLSCYAGFFFCFFCRDSFSTISFSYWYTKGVFLATYETFVRKATAAKK